MPVDCLIIFYLFLFYNFVYFLLAQKSDIFSSLLSNWWLSRRRLLLCCWFSFYLKKQVTNLTDLLFIKMYLCNYACVWSSYLCELLITCHVSKSLELLYFVALLDIKFLYCTLLYFLAKIGKIKLNKTKSKSSIKKKSFCFE